MRNINFVILCVFLLVACTKNDFISNPVNYESDSCAEGVLKVQSKQQISMLIDLMKENNSLDIKQLFKTKTSPDITYDDEFKSLRDYLIEQGLREFTDQELSIIVNEGLSYEPIDYLITDPYMMALLNQDREIQIDNKIYRFIDEGVVIYDVNDDEDGFDPNLISQIQGLPDLHQGNNIRICKIQ